MSKAQNPCLEYYGQLHKKMAALLESVEKEGLLEELTKAHAKTHDLELWLSALKNKKEADILSVAFQEYSFSLLCLVQGFYRQAFASLRLFMELTLAAIQLSIHELDLRMWFAGRKDINWNTIVDPDNGIFSYNFVQTFCQELASDAKLAHEASRKIYRECSEFIHGNHKANISLPQTIAFSKENFNAWIEKSKSAFFIVQYILTIRYIKEISNESLSKLEPSLSDELGHMDGFRILLIRQ